MIRTTTCCLFVLASIAAAPPARALTTTLPVTGNSPTIDGRIAPEDKAGASQITLKVIGGIDLPRNPTTAYLKLTSDALYVGYACVDSDPASVLTAARDGGAVFLDDSAQLFLAPAAEASRTNYFHFAVNASGARYSSCLSTDQPVEGWQAAAARTETGWECEMLIPLQALDASVDLRYWRANVARERPARGSDPQETTAWINPGASLHNYRRFGFFQLDGASQAIASLARQTNAATLETSAPVSAPAANAKSPAAFPAISPGTVAPAPGSLSNTTDTQTASAPSARQ